MWQPGKPLRVSLGGARFHRFCHVAIRQTIGRWAGDPLLLEPWQLDLASGLLQTDNERWTTIPAARARTAQGCAEAVAAWLTRLADEPPVEPGLRRYTEAYVQIAKKNGKSTLAAAFALYFLAADGENAPHVFSAATKRDQARIVFDQAKAMVEKSPVLADWCRVYRNTIVCPDNDGTFKVISADALFEEGANVHAAVIDELHRHRTRELYDVLKGGTIARSQPMILPITNAGADLETVCGQVYLQGKTGSRDDLFFYVPELGADDLDQIEHGKFAVAKKVNPASWITKAQLVKLGREKPPFVFKRFHCNFWTEADEAWLPPGAWERLAGTTPLERGDPIYVGIDASKNRDTTAVVWVSLKNGRWVARAQVWAVWDDPSKPKPAAHVHLRRSIPRRLIEDYVRELAHEYQLIAAPYDPYRFGRSAEDLEEEGLPMEEFPQSNPRMCPASQDLYDAIVDGSIEHDNDPVFQAQIYAGSVRDVGIGWRLDKRHSQRPMDCCIALLMAHRVGVEEEFGGAQADVTSLA
jgi:phage terminase large subunit-like protein